MDGSLGQMVEVNPRLLGNFLRKMVNVSRQCSTNFQQCAASYRVGVRFARITQIDTIREMHPVFFGPRGCALEVAVGLNE